MPASLRIHDSLVRQMIGKYGGREIITEGDSFQVGPSDGLSLPPSGDPPAAHIPIGGVPGLQLGCGLVHRCSEGAAQAKLAQQDGGGGEVPRVRPSSRLMLG